MTNADGFTLLRSPQVRFAFSALALILALMSCWRAALAAEPTKPAEQTKRFDLPSQSLSSALIAFNHQSGVQTLFGHDESENIDEILTSRVVGNFTAADALMRLLEGTGLRFQFYAANKIHVFRPPPSEPTPATQPPSLKAGFQPASHLTPIEDVQVTGTRIRGALDVISPTVIMPSRELRRSTFATVQDALYTLPHTSLAGPREDIFTAGNVGLAAGINLRHLGAGATLVLVNGHRQPVSGEEAAFTDVSNIPWVAVERIEIVPDGNSALYGSDAIAGVVNIIMRDDLDGAESQARFTSVSGGADELQASQLFGKRWPSGRALLAYQYSERAPLAAADRTYAASSDKRRFGGSDHRSYDAGNILDPVTLQPVLGIPATGVRSADDYSSDINLENQAEHWQLLPERQTHNAFLTATQTLGERWSIRADGRYGVRDMRLQRASSRQILTVPRSNPFFVDPFPDRASPGVLVAYNFLDDLGPVTYMSTTRVSTGAASASASFGRDWQLVLSHSYGREELSLAAENTPNPAAVVMALNQTDPARAFNPFGRTNPDVIAGIRQTSSLSALSGITTTTVIADGSLGRTTAGPVGLAIGAEYRRESFNAWRTGGGNPVRPEGTSITNQRYVGSVFAETSVPLIGNPRDSHAAPRVEVTAATRFENYSDFGHTFNPRLGLKWAPFDEVKLRGSWGRSFRAPTLVDRDTSRNLSGIVSLADPKSPSGRSAVLFIQGNNPDVREETATTWTAGLDWVPTTLTGLKLSLTYFDTSYGNRIVVPARNGPFQILLNEEEWASVINRHPTQSQIDAICRRADFLGPGSCAQTQPSTIIDARRMNLSETEMKGLDAQVGRSWDNNIGSWGLHLAGSYLFEFLQRSSPTAPVVDLLGTVRNPPTLRARASAEWSQHPAAVSGLSAVAAINYTNGFRDLESAPVRKVRPWTTVDLQLSYRTSAPEGWLAGVDVMLNAVNVLKAPPPFVDSVLGYDSFNAQPIGRAVSLEFRKSW